MRSGSANCIWMVRPAAFYANAETAITNYFQKVTGENSSAAFAEFDAVINKLDLHAIDVLVTQSNDVLAPDAIFPNNWISFHDDGFCVLYPMNATSRRRERDLKLPLELSEKFPEVYDFTFYEKQHKFLEGTGSVVFDHEQKIAFAVLSERTHKDVLEDLCNHLGYESCSFYAFDKDGKAVYHTNVVMFIGDKIAAVCADSIFDLDDRNRLLSFLGRTHREVVRLSIDQMHSFCGNMLQVRNKMGDKKILLSSTADKALTAEQKCILEKDGELVVFEIPIIENIGGGSIRCMMAEIYNPK
jgi:hypothetical protein